MKINFIFFIFDRKFANLQKEKKGVTFSIFFGLVSFMLLWGFVRPKLEINIFCRLYVLVINLSARFFEHFYFKIDTAIPLRARVFLNKLKLDKWI